MFYPTQALAKLQVIVRSWARTGPAYPRLWLRGINTILFLCSGILAFFIRFEFRIPPEHRAHALYAVFTWTIVKSITAYFYRTDRGWWRFVSVFDVVRISLANLTASVISAGLLVLACTPRVPALDLSSGFRILFAGDLRSSYCRSDLH